MPRHPSSLQHAQSVASVVGNLLEVQHPGIIVILAWEKGLFKVCRVDIGQGVALRIPFPETEIKTTNRGVVIIDDYDLGSSQQADENGKRSIPSRGETRTARCLHNEGYVSWEVSLTQLQTDL